MMMQSLRKLIWFFEAGELVQTLGMMSPSGEAAMISRLVLRSFSESEAWCMISESMGPFSWNLFCVKIMYFKT